MDTIAAPPTAAKSAVGTTAPAIAAAAMAASVFAVVAIHSVLAPDPRDWRTAAMAVGFALVVVALAGVQAVQHSLIGRTGRVAFVVLEVSVAANAALFAAAAAGTDPAPALAAPAGLGFVVTMIVVGVSTVRARVFPRRVGLAIALAEPATVALGLALSPIAPLHDYGGYTGALGLAAAMAVIAVDLAGLPKH